MTYKQAVRLAVQAMERWIEEVNVNANLHDLYGMDTPSGKNDSQRRKKLREAIEHLQGAML